MNRVWAGHPETFLLRVAPLPILALILIFSLVSGCTSSGTVNNTPSVLPEPAGSQAVFIVQNVVANASSETIPDNNAGPKDRTAAAIRNAMDADNPVTRDFAVSRIPHAHGGLFNAAQLCDLWETVYSRWTYVGDPRGTEYFSPASRTISLGLKGDCDDFAIVMGSLIESVGGSSRVVYAYNGTAGHAYPEVYIGTTQEEFDAVAGYIRKRYGVTEVSCHITRDGSTIRYWLNLDWWSQNPGGRFYADDGERTAYYPDGHWEQVVS